MKLKIHIHHIKYSIEKVQFLIQGHFFPFFFFVTNVVQLVQIFPSCKITKMSINNLNREEHRLRTFDENWPHAFIDTNILAKTGLYYFGPHDQVKCHFCGLEINNWEMGDNEIFYHKRWSPNCPLLKQQNTSNIPMSSNRLSNEHNDIHENDQRPLNTTPITSPSSVSEIVSMMQETNISKRPQILQRPKFPEMAIESARLRTFKEWPKSMKQRPKELCDAGFFYTYKSDCVICFSCGGTLRDWDEDDIAWEQHALWFDTCNYVQLLKGQEYVNMMRNKIWEIKTFKTPLKSTSATETVNIAPNISTSVTPTQKELTEIDDKKSCKICFSNNFNTIFLPCGHIACCAKCASSITKCPICQKPLEQVMRVYFS